MIRGLEGARLPRKVKEKLAVRAVILAVALLLAPRLAVAFLWLMGFSLIARVARFARRRAWSALLTVRVGAAWAVAPLAVVLLQSNLEALHYQRMLQRDQQAYTPDHAT